MSRDGRSTRGFIEQDVAPKTSVGVRAGLGHPGAIVVRNLLVVVGLTTVAGLSWQIRPERIIAHLQPLGWRSVLEFILKPSSV
jgi:hypothetical protein